MAMKIWSHHGVIKECSVVFDYRGYSLSLTTLSDPNEFRIFNSEESMMDLTHAITGMHSLSCDAADIRVACDFIDDFINKKETGEIAESQLRKSGGQ